MYNPPYTPSYMRVKLCIPPFLCNEQVCYSVVLDSWGTYGRMIFSHFLSTITYSRGVHTFSTRAHKRVLRHHVPVPLGWTQRFGVAEGMGNPVVRVALQGRCGGPFRHRRLKFDPSRPLLGLKSEPYIAEMDGPNVHYRIPRFVRGPANRDLRGCSYFIFLAGRNQKRKQKEQKNAEEEIMKTTVLKYRSMRSGIGTWVSHHMFSWSLVYWSLDKGTETSSDSAPRPPNTTKVISFCNWVSDTLVLFTWFRLELVVKRRSPEDIQPFSQSHEVSSFYMLNRTVEPTLLE